MPEPFTDEGPQYYGLAYARNKPFAKPGPYFTTLSPQEEQQFRLWLKTSGNPSKYDPDAKITDYDMRGYWKDVVAKGRNESAINKSDMRLHFPDTYKTPFDTTFSGESRYAQPNVPLKWVDAGIPGKERLINTKTGEVMFQKKTQPTPLYPDFSQPSVMNPRYSPLVSQMFGPLIKEQQRQQQFGSQFAQDPRQAIKPTPEEVQRSLQMGLAFGGADITKEQRAAWEQENAAYRASQMKTSGEPLTPGTRVREAKTVTYGSNLPEGHLEGTVVTPGTPEAGEPGHNVGPTAPTPEHVPVKSEGSSYWFWRHRDHLEALPPEQELKEGDAVTFNSLPDQTTNIYEGVVSKPPADASPSPGPDFIWVDVDRRTGKPVLARQWVKRYASGDWGHWFHKSAWLKKGK